MSQSMWRLCILVVLGAVATGTVGYSADTRPAQAKNQGTSFNSRLPLNVVALTEDPLSVYYPDGPKTIGKTPSEQPLEIPSGQQWFVEPRGPANMDWLRREIQEKGIPGLRLWACGDDDLGHLKSLTGLRWLCLDGTQITGAGLVHLEGLTKL